MSTDTPNPVPDRLECRACRGTGKVVSNLGGSPNEVPCPWCDGTGRFIPGHVAQPPEDQTDVQTH